MEDMEILTNGPLRIDENTNDITHVTNLGKTLDLEETKNLFLLLFSERQSRATNRIFITKQKLETLRDQINKALKE